MPQSATKRKPGRSPEEFRVDPVVSRDRASTRTDGSGLTSKTGRTDGWVHRQVARLVRAGLCRRLRSFAVRKQWPGRTGPVISLRTGRPQPVGTFLGEITRASPRKTAVTGVTRLASAMSVLAITTIVAFSLGR